MRTGTLLAVLTASAAPVAAQVCSIERLSVDAQGLESDGPSSAPVISPDGRYVAFVSTATNFVPGDANGVADVFVRDLLLGTIERVSVGPGGVESDAACAGPALSDDGRYVAFQTAATTLVPGVTNAALDVYLVDRALGTVERVSLGHGGVEGDGPSFGATLAGGARWITFASWASNLVPGDTNGTRDVFLFDRELGTIERVSISSSGVEGNDMSASSSLLSFVTPEGRYVLFGSMASNLVSNDANGAMDAFVRDRWQGTTALLVAGPGGAAPNGWTDVGSLTRDGRYVGFSSSAPHLVPNDTNGAHDAFVLDRASGAIERVNVDDSGAESGFDAFPPLVSRDGRFAVFTSSAPDLVPADGNGRRDVFRRDRAAGTTELLALTWLDMQPLADIFSISVTAAADALVFSYAGDDAVFADLNGVGDVFLRACAAGRPFCSGDGSGTPCPCGAGPAGAGCPHSGGAAASLVGAGRPRTSGDTLALVARDVPGGTTVMFLLGSIQQNGGAGSTFGDGLRCVGGTFTLLGTSTAAAGVASFGFGVPGAPLLSVASAVPQGGDVRYYQAWYRNPAPYCTPATFNLTNGLEVVWAP